MFVERGKSNVASNCSPAGEEVVSAVFSVDVCALAIGSCTPGDLLSDKAELSTGTQPQPAPSIHPCLQKAVKERVSSGSKSAHSSLCKDPASSCRGGSRGSAQWHEAAPCSTKSLLCPAWVPTGYKRSPCSLQTQFVPKQPKAHPRKDPENSGAGVVLPPLPALPISMQ